MEQNEVPQKEISSLRTNEQTPKISCTRKKKSSLKSIEFSLGKAQVCQEKGDFFEEQCAQVLQEGSNSPINNHVPNHFVITTISGSFSYKLVTYHCKKVLKRVTTL